jgi:hypothetical protein
VNSRSKSQQATSGTPVSGGSSGRAERKLLHAGAQLPCACVVILHENLHAESSFRTWAETGGPSAAQAAGANRRQSAA